jgi:predicted N-acetyltransferase YhbS
MTAGSVSIREPQTTAELVATHNLLSEVFGNLPPAEDQQQRALAWRDRRMAWNELMPSSTRSAFRGETCVGSYQLDIRTLQVGGALIPVGCIGAVATYPHYRNQGVASALMRDAEEIARSQGIGLLLLHGIGNFYHRFGYTNIANLVVHQIERDAVLALPRSDCLVRSAMIADSDSLLELYRRHQHCFIRTPALQAARLRGWIDGNRAPLLAVDASGVVCGYLLPPYTDELLQVPEVAADTWDAAAALLQWHAQQQSSDEIGPLRWVMAQQSPTYYLLAEHVRVVSRIESIPNAEWMGRIGSLPVLMQSLVLAWQQHGEHPEALRWVIDDTTTELNYRDRQLAIEPVAPDAASIRMSQASFTRLLFRYRTVAWEASQPGNTIPPQLIPYLERLFAANSLFVPESDGF